MDGLIFVLIIFTAISALISKKLFSPAVKGLLGEHVVRRILSDALDASHYTILHDVTLNTRRGTTQIDHVVVSPYGIFVLETKNLSGWIFGSEFDSHWTQSFRRTKVRFQNPLRQNHAHVKALQALLALDASNFHSVVVFCGAAGFKTPMPENVVKAKQLIRLIRKRTTPIIDHDNVTAIVGKIESNRLAPGFKTTKAHIDSLRVKHQSLSGTIEDSRNLLRRGMTALNAVRVAARMVTVVGIVFIGGYLFNSLSKLASVGIMERPGTIPVQAAPGETRSGKDPDNEQSDESRLPQFQRTESLIEKSQREQAARIRQKEIDAHLAWQTSLMCGYSTDTMRCACYDPEAGKVEMEFNACKALADKGTGMVRN